MDEVGGMPHRPLVRDGRLVRALAAQVHVRAADAPELQAAGPPDLVKLEVPLVAGVALVSAPDLHGRAGVAHQRRDGDGRTPAASIPPGRRRTGAGAPAGPPPAAAGCFRPDRAAAGSRAWQPIR